jgi:hypothetical protein
MVDIAISALCLFDFSGSAMKPNCFLTNNSADFVAAFFLLSYFCFSISISVCCALVRSSRFFLAYRVAHRRLVRVFAFDVVCFDVAGLIWQLSCCFGFCSDCVGCFVGVVDSEVVVVLDFELLEPCWCRLLLVVLLFGRDRLVVDLFCLARFALSRLVKFF